MNEDKTQKTLIAAMIIISVIIILILLSRGFRGGYAYRYGQYQQASSIGAFDGRQSYRYPQTTTDTVTSYSRPSHYTNFGSVETTSTTTTTQYDTVHTYYCQDDYCWTE